MSNVVWVAIGLYVWGAVATYATIRVMAFVAERYVGTRLPLGDTESGFFVAVLILWWLAPFALLVEWLYPPAPDVMHEVFRGVVRINLTTEHEAAVAARAAKQRLAEAAREARERVGAVAVLDTADEPCEHD